MTYVAWWDTSVEEVPDAVAAAKVFDTVTPGYAPHGGRGHALWFAPADSEDAVLRVDVDVDAGRAALRWMPDETHAVELEPAGPIVVLETSDGGVVGTVPAEMARVSIETARRAVIEYVTTGQRPTGVEWVAA